MADENKLATFKWFTDTYTCGTLDLGISDTIFNYPYYTTSDKVINYKDLVKPDDYKNNASISNSTNFVDGENNKCILQSHIKELINNDEIYTYKIGFQKTELLSGNYLGYDCLYVKMIDFFLNSNNTPPDNKIKIKIIIYDSENNETSHTVNIPFATTDKDYTYIIVPDINRVEIVGVSVYRQKYAIDNTDNYSYNDFIIQPNIEYSYTYNLRDYISAAKKDYDGNFNGSKITRGGRIDIFVSGSSTPGTGDNSGDSGDSGDSTQKDFVIQDNWVDLDSAVNINSEKICWAAVEYINNETDTILISSYDPFDSRYDPFDSNYDPFCTIYASLSNSTDTDIIKDIIEQINKINNSGEYIFIAFKEINNGEMNKTDIGGLKDYELFDDLPETIHILELTKFIEYGDNLIKPDKNE